MSAKDIWGWGRGHAGCLNYIAKKSPINSAKTPYFSSPGNRAIFSNIIGAIVNLLDYTLTPGENSKSNGFSAVPASRSISVPSDKCGRTFPDIYFEAKNAMKSINLIFKERAPTRYFKKNAIPLPDPPILAFFDLLGPFVFRIILAFCPRLSFHVSKECLA